MVTHRRVSSNDEMPDGRTPFIVHDNDTITFASLENENAWMTCENPSAVVP